MGNARIAAANCSAGRRALLSILAAGLLAGCTYAYEDFRIGLPQEEPSTGGGSGNESGGSSSGSGGTTHSGSGTGGTSQAGSGPGSGGVAGNAGAGGAGTT